MLIKMLKNRMWDKICFQILDILKDIHVNHLNVWIKKELIYTNSLIYAVKPFTCVYKQAIRD